MKKGFTLIEMVIVIVLLGILSAIVVPSVDTYRNSAYESEITAIRRNFVNNLALTQSFFRIDPSPTNCATDSSDCKVNLEGGGGIGFNPDGTFDGVWWSGGYRTFPESRPCQELFKSLGGVESSEVSGADGRTWKARHNAMGDGTPDPASGDGCVFKHQATLKYFIYDNTNGGSVGPVLDT